jgi:transposase-like protein
MAVRSDKRYRVFPAALKLDAVNRLEAGEALAAVARELGISRKILYGWRTAWRAEGIGWLDRRRGPKPGLRKRRLAAALAAEMAPAAPDQTQALARAEARIGELERIVGRQQAGLDFFQRALQALDAIEMPSSSAPNSTPPSRR